METLTHFDSSSHLFLEEYNTTIKIYSNGTEKIKKTSFSNMKGHALGGMHNGKYSIEKLEEKSREYLKKVKTNIIDLAFNYSKWEYFITLTFDFRDKGEYSHEKAIDLLSKWIDNQKHQNKNMTYLIVPEFHKSGRLHFHGLIANVPKWKFSEARTPKGRLIKQNGIQIYNLDNYNLGFTTISEIQSQEKVSNYISKYATKELITLKNKKRYWYSRNLEKPKTDYLYLDTNLDEFLKQNNKIITYYEVFNKDNCSIEIGSYN